MPPLDQDETQRRINEAKAKTAQARKAMKDASDLANYITKPFENGMKSVDKVLGYVETGIDIFNIVMVVVICGSIMLCIISPLIYIITTLITSISQCVAQCKSNKNQETDDYTKLNERILFIETNNGLKPAATGDKNQNDVTGEGGGGGHGKGASQRPSAKKGVQEGSGGATSGAAASGPGVSGGGNSTVKSTAKSVDAKEQQKS
uniref:Uncharacterized protein n=1 Tax=Panagrolaimus superbus TaxID=310955 RepID=A0A914Y2F9_9BILA